MLFFIIFLQVIFTIFTNFIKIIVFCGLFLFPVILFILE